MDVSQNEVPEDPPLLKAAQDHVLVDLSRGREIEDPSRGHVFEDPLQYCEIEEQMTSPGSKLSTRKQDTLYSYKKKIEIGIMQRKIYLLNHVKGINNLLRPNTAIADVL